MLENVCHSEPQVRKLPKPGSPPVQTDYLLVLTTVVHVAVVQLPARWVGLCPELDRKQFSRVDLSGESVNVSRRASSPSGCSHYPH